MPKTFIHPARFSSAILGELKHIALTYADETDRYVKVLDPFAGTGRIHELMDADPRLRTYGIEIEPEWAALHERTQQGDATALPFRANYFDLVITSPTYGNRLADHHAPKDDSVRRSYVFDLRSMTGDQTRQLAPSNTGQYTFMSKEYKELHCKAWAEARRVLVQGGWLVVNVKDVIMGKKVRNVCEWHRDVILAMGFDLVDSRQVETPGLRYGRNAEARIPYEMIYVFSKTQRR